MQQKVGPTLSYKEEISSINPHDPENWDWKKTLVCNLSLFGLEGENVTQRGGVPFQTPPGLSRGTVSTSCASMSNGTFSLDVTLYGGFSSRGNRE